MFDCGHLLSLTFPCSPSAPHLRRPRKTHAPSFSTRGRCKPHKPLPSCGKSPWPRPLAIVSPQPVCFSSLKAFLDQSGRPFLLFQKRLDYTNNKPFIPSGHVCGIISLNICTKFQGLHPVSEEQLPQEEKRGTGNMNVSCPE